MRLRCNSCLEEGDSNNVCHASSLKLPQNVLDLAGRIGRCKPDIFKDCQLLTKGGIFALYLQGHLGYVIPRRLEPATDQ